MGRARRWWIFGAGLLVMAAIVALLVPEESPTPPQEFWIRVGDAEETMYLEPGGRECLGWRCLAATPPPALWWVARRESTWDKCLIRVGLRRRPDGYEFWLPHRLPAGPHAADGWVHMALDDVDPRSPPADAR